ncbi:MAG: hypothetical protein WCE20_14455 [Rhizomicrobium sp.]
MQEFRPGAATEAEAATMEGAPESAEAQDLGIPVVQRNHFPVASRVASASPSGSWHIFQPRSLDKWPYPYLSAMYRKLRDRRRIVHRILVPIGAPEHRAH